jgi:hypothetical protein
MYSKESGFTTIPRCQPFNKKIKTVAVDTIMKQRIKGAQNKDKIAGFGKQDLRSIIAGKSKGGQANLFSVRQSQILKFLGSL